MFWRGRAEDDKEKQCTNIYLKLRMLADISVTCVNISMSVCASTVYGGA